MMMMMMMMMSRTQTVLMSVADHHDICTMQKAFDGRGLRMDPRRENTAPPELLAGFRGWKGRKEGKERKKK